MKTVSYVLVGPFPVDATRIHGGVQASVAGLASGLSDAGLSGVSIDVLIVATPTNDTRSAASGWEDSYSGARVYRIAPLWQSSLQSAVLRFGRAWKVVTGAKSPIIHVHGSGLLESVLLVCSRMRGYQPIWTLHGLTVKEERARLRRHRSVRAWLRLLLAIVVERVAFAAAKVVIVDTEYVAAEMGRRGRAAKTHVVPQGIFPEDFASGEDCAQEHAGCIFLSVGVFDRRKGHHRTIAAFSRAYRNNPSMRLVIAGAVSDTSYLNELQSQVLSLDLCDVVLFRVNCSRGQLLELFRMSRFFVLLSEEESQGIALVEAMAAGLTIIASSVGGIPFVIKSGVSGILVDPHIDTAVDSAFLRVLEDEAYADMLRTNARSAASAFSWADISKQVLKLVRHRMERA